MKHITAAIAHKSSAPVSQAVQSGNLVFTSGIVGVHRRDGVLAEGAKAQARQALENLAAILAAAGSGIERVVKVTIFLRDSSDYSMVNEVYVEYFAPPYPARSTIQASAPNPNVLVEIEAVAEVEPASIGPGP